MVTKKGRKKVVKKEERKLNNDTVWKYILMIMKRKRKRNTYTYTITYAIRETDRERKK